ncbi:MAG: S9 family peptidase [Planctomycetota bacterium]|nr:S9 family peptidase [Planctomycetota bacterium]
MIDDWWYRFDGDGYFNAQRFHLYLVDVATGSHKKIYDKDTLGFFEFDFSPDSRQIVLNVNHDRKALIKPEQTQLVRLNLSTGKATIIPNLPEGPKASPKWSPDGKRIAYAGRAGEGDIYSVENLELWVCDPIKGKPKSITAKSDYCLLAVSLSDTADVAFGPTFQWRPDSRRILVKLGWHGQVHIASIKPSGGPIDFLTKGRIDYDMGNISADSKHIALTSSTTTSLSETMVGTLSNDSIETWQITNFNGPLFKQRTLSRPSTAWVKTNENSKVHVWTMLPPNFSPRKKYPAVLQIHGGPHAQYGEGFFHEFQTLASAGYIVFFSNPRGSKGYGRDHTAHLKWKWGINDWPDFQAVIEHMKNHPNVDTKRMGVMGGSYGGFSTNWIISHCRDFAGAITDRCVSNLVSLGGNSDWIEKPDGYFPGNFWDRPEQRWDCSPIKYFKNVKTPTLIIHSEGDLRCNIEQADQVFTALKLLNVPTRLVRYPQTTSHGMSRGGPPDMRIHRLHQILDWWNRYLQ